MASVGDPHPVTRSTAAEPSAPALAIVADDLTGAADIAGILRRAGVRVSLVAGDPVSGSPVPAVDAIVVGLRIRTAPVAEAVERTSAAADWLLRAGAAVLAWKICSTFDSTPAGNIGPVTDALLALTGLPAALVCPAFAENGRVVRGGRLYVHGVALDESPMRDHPLTPMRDADLARLLAPQVAEPGRIVRIDAAGDATGAIEAAIAAGARYLIPDAPDDAAATALGDAVVGRALPVVASGLVPGLVAGLRRAGRLPGAPTEPPAVPRAGGPALIVAGSCSTATRAQVERFATTYPVVRIDAAGDATGAIEAAIAAGARYLIPDAPDDAAAAALGDAVVGRALPVVASGLVPGLVAGLRRAGRLAGAPTEPPAVPRAGGPALIVAGSCSTATRAQVERFATTYPVVRLEHRLADPAAAAIRAARQALFEGASAVLVASSADPAGVAAVQRELGPRAGARIEHWLGQVAAALVEDGVRRLAVAGGETTGAVIDALGVRMFEVGGELAPGVPVLTADHDGGRLLLVAKSGNFGGPDLFAQVLDATRMDEGEVAQAERRMG